MYVGHTIGFGNEKFKLVLDGAIANSADKREHRKDGNFTKKLNNTHRQFLELFHTVLK